MSDTVLPHESPASAAPEASAADLRRARIENLLGLVTPVTNLGMRHVAPPDLRWFGVGAGVVLHAFAAVAWWKGAYPLVAVAVAVNAALVLSGLVNPRFPEIPGRLWISFGTLLGKVMAYPLFGLLYFLVVTPTAVLVRLFVGDPLRRKAPPQATYWIDREPAPKERFERQF